MKNATDWLSNSICVAALWPFKQLIFEHKWRCNTCRQKLWRYSQTHGSALRYVCNPTWIFGEIWAVLQLMFFALASKFKLEIWMPYAGSELNSTRVALWQMVNSSSKKEVSSCLMTLQRPYFHAQRNSNTKCTIIINCTHCWSFLSFGIFVDGNR